MQENSLRHLDNLWVVIPAYNVATFLGEVIKRVLAWIPAQRVVVVDDGSQDETSAVASLQAVHLLRHTGNCGKGAALLSGFNFIKRNSRQGDPIIVTLDGDGQHPPEYIPHLVGKLVSDHLDLAIGRRVIRGSSMPWDRRFSNWTTSHLLTLFLRTKIWDSQCGFRAFRWRVLEGERYFTLNYDFETEFLIKAVRRGVRIGWVDIPTIYGHSSSSIRRMRDTVRFVRTVLRCIIGS